MGGEQGGAHMDGIKVPAYHCLFCAKSAQLSADVPSVSCPSPNVWHWLSNLQVEISGTQLLS